MSKKRSSASRVGTVHRHAGKVTGTFWGEKKKSKPTIDTSNNPLAEWLAKTDPRKSGK